VLESGSCDVFVTRPGDITPKKVKSYGPGSAFGELALLYAAPRAATVSLAAHLLDLAYMQLKLHAGCNPCAPVRHWHWKLCMAQGQALVSGW
jgi:hypothetical protein